MEDKKEQGRKVLLRGPENYEDWAQVIRMRLLAARVWHTVLVEPEESEMKPAQTSATGSKGQRIEATKEWQDSKAEEGKAADIILSSISEEQQKHVRRIEHPYHIWKTLKGIHERPNNEKLHNAMVQLFSKDLGRTIEERGSRIRVLNAEIESYDSTLKLPEKTLVILLLESLTPEYDTMKKILITTDQIDELDKVLQKLAGEEARIVKGEAEQALAVCKEGKGRSKGRRDGKDMKCFRCDRTGHRKSECFATRSADGTPLEDEPPVKPRKRGEKARAATYREDEEGEKTYLTCLVPELVIGEPRTSDWIVDSGATRHMSWDLGLFVELKPMGGHLSVANGDRLAIKGVGTVRTRFNQQSGVATVTGVLYVPGLTANLMSVSDLDKKGFETTTKNGEMAIIKNGRGRVTARREKGTYHLKANGEVVLATGQESPTGGAGQESPADVKKKTWHRRLGHASKAVMKRAALTGKLEGFEYDEEEVENCEDCILAKMQKTLRKKAEATTTRKLELVHTDVCGPLQDEGYDGSRYLLTMIDDWTRMTWVYPMKLRSELPVAFGSWKAMVERESGEKLCRIRCDNAKEYISQYLKRLKPEGVREEPTVPYNPQQNGVAERYNRTIIGRVKAMLADAELPMQLWPVAAQTSAYLDNKLPHGDRKDLPEGEWTGRTVNAGHLRAFGCVAYVHIPKEKRKKLDQLAWKGVMVGYRGNHIYLVWNPETKKIAAAASVRFMEEIVGQRAQVRPKEKVSIEGGWPQVTSGPEHSIEGGWPQVTSVPEQRRERQVQGVPDRSDEPDEEDSDEESVRYDAEGTEDSPWQPRQGVAEETVEAPEEGAQESNESEGRGRVEPERSPQENRATGKATKEGSERAQETEPVRRSTRIRKATGKAKEGAFATEERGAVAPVPTIPRSDTCLLRKCSRTSSRSHSAFRHGRRSCRGSV